jgi:DNA-binding transcriptional LysR family regulator
MRYNLTLADLEAFNAVAGHLSFNKAAAALTISPSALSRRINKLEEILGVQLIERTTRVVRLTALGADFHRRTRDMLDNIDHSLGVLAEQTLQRSTVIAVACVPSVIPLILTPVLERLKAALPSVKVRIMDMSAHDTIAAVKASDVELGIGPLAASDVTVSFTPILADPFVLGCHKDHPFFNRKKIEWMELEGSQVIAVTKGTGNRLVLDAQLAEWGAHLPWTYEIRHLATAIAMVERALGVAVVPKSSLAFQSNAFIRGIPLVAPKLTRTIGIIQKADVPAGSTARAMIDFLKAGYSSRVST